MSFQRPIQRYYSHVDLIWSDGFGRITYGNVYTSINWWQNYDYNISTKLFYFQVFVDITKYFLCWLDIIYSNLSAHLCKRVYSVSCCTLADMSVGLVKTLYFDQIMCFVRYTPLSQDPLFPQLYDKADGMRVLEGGGGKGGRGVGQANHADVTLPSRTWTLPILSVLSKVILDLKRPTESRISKRKNLYHFSFFTDFFCCIAEEKNTKANSQMMGLWGVMIFIFRSIEFIP